MRRILGLGSSLGGFRLIGVAFTIFVILNLAFFVPTTLSQTLSGALSLTPDQPWGIITSVFVHDGPVHLAPNVVFFAVWCILLVALNSLKPVEQRFSESRFFLWAIFISGFLTNGIELLVWSSTGATGVSSLGSSGVVYSALGFVFATALFNFPRNMSRFSSMLMKMASGRKLVDFPVRRTFLAGVLTPAVFLGIIFTLVLSPNDFFAAVRGADVFGHATGFLLGLAAAWIFFLRRFVESRD